jgi:hypothetical protein
MHWKALIAASGRDMRIVKLPPRPGAGRLPGNVISFYIVPLDPAYPALAGGGTFRPKGIGSYPGGRISYERDF